MRNSRESMTYLLEHPGLAEFLMCHPTSSGQNAMRCRNPSLRRFIWMMHIRMILMERFQREACCGFSTMRNRKRMGLILLIVVVGVSCTKKTIPDYNELRHLPNCLPRASLKPVLSALL